MLPNTALITYKIKIVESAQGTTTAFTSKSFFFFFLCVCVCLRERKRGVYYMGKLQIKLGNFNSK